MGSHSKSLVRRIIQGITFLCFLLFGLILFSGWQAKKTPTDAEPLPLLAVDESDLDLGTIWQQAEHQIRIPFHNRSDREVVVADLRPSCNCTTLTPRTFALKPGETQVVSATIDLLKSIPDDNEMQAPFMVSLDARIVRPREAFEDFAVKGFVRRSMVVKPREIHLVGAYELIDGVPPESITIDVEPRIDLESLDASVSQRMGSARCAGPDEEGRFQVEFTPSANLPRGPVQGVLTLQTFLQTGKKGPSLDIPISGRVTGPVHFSPNQVVVTKNQHDEAVLGSHVVALHDRDGADWTIDGVESDCKFVRCRIVENGTRLTAFVDQTAEETAADLPRETTLTVNVKSNEGRRERLLLPVQLAPYSAFSQKE